MSKMEPQGQSGGIAKQTSEGQRRRTREQRIQPHRQQRTLEEEADLNITTEASPKGMKVRTINYSKEKKNIDSLNNRFSTTFTPKVNTLVGNGQG